MLALGQNTNTLITLKMWASSDGLTPELYRRPTGTTRAQLHVTETGFTQAAPARSVGEQPISDPCR